MTIKKDQVYEGKAKILYATDNPKELVVYFKDDATAFNNQKKGTIIDKGVMNNAITSRIFQLLDQSGVPNHFVEKLSDREQLVKHLKIIPIEVLVRNVVAGSLAKRMGMEEGKTLSRPIVEYCYKDDALGDPFINEDHALVFDLCTKAEIDEIKKLALKVNDFLIGYFDNLGIRLVDFKLEFGRYEGKILLGDEITPDGCRLWDKVSGEKLDKDRFRRDLGGVEEAYQRVYKSVCG